MDTHSHCGLWAYVYPVGGTWTQENIDAVIARSSAYPSLRGIRQDRGFSFPSSDAAKQWQRTVFKRDYDYVDIRTAGPDAFVGTDPGCIGSLPFYFRGGNRALQNVLQLWTKFGATMRQIIDLIKVLQEEGHVLVATKGFDMSGRLKPNSQTRSYYVTKKQAIARGWTFD